MTLLKQPWFLIFLILVGIYSHSSLTSSSISVSVNEAQADEEKASKKGKKRKIQLTQAIEGSIDTLKINGFEAMGVTLEASEEAQVSLELKGRGRRYINQGKDFSDWLEARVSNGILKVSPTLKKADIEILDLFANDDLHLTLRYPRSQKFDEIEILTISGDVLIKDSFAKDIRIKSVSGDVDFEKVNCKNLIVEAVSSDLDLSSLFAARAVIKTVSGDATITSITELPSYTFKSVSGDLNLKLPKTAQVDVNFKSMTGELINQFIKKGQTAGSIEVSSMSGDAKITKIQ